MKNLMKSICLLLFVVLVGSFMSCKAVSDPVPTLERSNTITKTEIVHDTIFKIAQDNSYYKALLDCQNGKVIVKDISVKQAGRGLKIPDVKIDNNELQVDCEARAQELLAQYKDTQVANIETKTVVVTQIKNELTGWQNFQIWSGRLFIGSLATLCIVKSIPFKFL